MQGLADLDMQATQALLKGKAPKNLRIPAKGKRKLAQFLSGSVRRLRRIYAAKLCASPPWCFRGDPKREDGSPMYRKKEETKVLTMKIARNENGSFGVMLNDHNRVCSDTARARRCGLRLCPRVRIGAAAG